MTSTDKVRIIDDMIKKDKYSTILDYLELINEVEGIELSHKPASYLMHQIDTTIKHIDKIIFNHKTTNNANREKSS